jgi:hypothetical protein
MPPLLLSSLYFLTVVFGRVNEQALHYFVIFHRTIQLFDTTMNRLVMQYHGFQTICLLLDQRKMHRQKTHRV